MKNTLVKAAIMSLVVGLAACGGEATQVSVDSEEAGENCEAGGVKVTIDGEDHYVCDGADGTDGDDGSDGNDGADGESPHIMTATVEAGEGDNPCEHSAIEITVENPDGSTVVEYLCQPPEPSDFFEAVIDAQVTVTNEPAALYCECSWEDEEFASADECIEALQIPYAEEQGQRVCIREAYEAYEREAPSGFADLESCVVDATDVFEGCLDDIEEIDQCTTDGDDAVTACESDFYDANDQCFIDHIEGEAEAWFNDFSDFIDGYCPAL